MSDVKRLLEQATPLPWRFDEDDRYFFGPEGCHPDYGDQINWDTEGLGGIWANDVDPALIVHAVNHLPEYEAAVDTLERLSEVAMTEEEDWSPRTQDEWVAALNDAGTILRRLRGDPAA